MGEADENAAASHTGHILCMNVAGGDNDPKQNQAHEAIVAAYKQAVTSNARPGIILLQEYKFVVSGIKKVLKQLHGDWKYTRHQWEGQSRNIQYDTVVLYDSSIYIAGEFDKKHMNGTSTYKSYQEGDKTGLYNYDVRWSGGHVCVKESDDLQFVVVSYHGRSNHPTKKGERNSIPISGSALKAELSRRFAIIVGAACADKKLNTKIDALNSCTGLPAIIAGDWNSDHNSSFAAFKHQSDKWSLAHYPPIVDVKKTVRKDKAGYPKDILDYFVVINMETIHDLSCKINIESQPVALEHTRQHKSLFDHDPILATFKLTRVYAKTTVDIATGIETRASTTQKAEKEGDKKEAVKGRLKPKKKTKKPWVSRAWRVLSKDIKRLSGLATKESSLIPTLEASFEKPSVPGFEDVEPSNNTQIVSASTRKSGKASSLSRVDLELKERNSELSIEGLRKEIRSMLHSALDLPQSRKQIPWKRTKGSTVKSPIDVFAWWPPEVDCSDAFQELRLPALRDMHSKLLAEVQAKQKRADTTENALQVSAAEKELAAQNELVALDNNLSLNNTAPFENNNVVKRQEMTKKPSALSRIFSRGRSNRTIAEASFNLPSVPGYDGEIPKTATGDIANKVESINGQATGKVQSHSISVHESDSELDESVLLLAAV